MVPTIHFDSGKNPESGVYWPLLQKLIRKSPNLIGCNFSCHKNTIEVINGFNEDYKILGTGEDTDIEWRFRKAGFIIRSLKFTAPLYHLFHKRSVPQDDLNQKILKETKAANKWRCENGLVKTSKIEA
jgi:GT2 family glycosyltransferase